MPQHPVLPDKLIEAIKFHMTTEGYSLAYIHMNDIGVILYGKDHGPNDAAIIIAHTLLSGVIDGVFIEQNNQLLNTEEKEVLN
jgi:hypothetical protein